MAAPIVGPRLPPPRLVAPRPAPNAAAPPAKRRKYPPPPEPTGTAAPAPTSGAAPCWAKTDASGHVLSFGMTQPAIFAETVRRTGAIAITADQHRQLRAGGKHVLQNGTLTAVKE